MKLLLKLFIVFSLMACNNRKPIYYEYNNIVVTRVDRGNKIYFYYGKYSKGNYPSNYVKAEYHGFNSGMRAFLTFRNDGKVEIRRQMGSLSKKGNDTNLIINGWFLQNGLIIDNDDNQFSKWWDTVRNDYNNTVEVLDVLGIEQKRNIENHSKVIAIYPQD